MSTFSDLGRQALASVAAIAITATLLVGSFAPPAPVHSVTTEITV